MKKMLALLMAAVILLCMFAACSTTEDEPSQTSVGSAPDPSQNADNPPPSEPTEETKFIACAANNLNDGFIVGLVNTIEEYCKADGITFQATSCESNIALQIEQIENFVSMGVNAIICMPKSTDGLKDTALSAMERGTYMIYLGGTPSDYYISGLVNVSQELVGEAAAKMALKWVDAAYPEGVKAALYRYTTTDEMISRTDAMEEVFREDGRVNIVFVKDLIEGALVSGYTGAEEALTYDPEIRLFMCFSSSVALGASNYIMSRTDLNSEEYATFGSEDDADARAAIDLSQTGESRMLGLIAYGGANPADTLYACAYDLIMGNVEPPDYRFDEVFTYNVVGFEL